MIEKSCRAWKSFALAAVLAIAAAPAFADPIQMRISLGLSPDHVTSKVTQRFADLLKAKAGDQLAIKVYVNSQLFADQDVPEALREGAVEMGVLSQGGLIQFVPDLNMLQMPMFYGYSADQMNQIGDGPIGQTINHELENKLNVKVIGKWQELGFSQVFSATRPIRTPDDIKGMKIRSPGGVGPRMAIQAFHANPFAAPWSDVPMALSSHTFDGLITSNEGVSDAKLYQVGIKYSFQANLMFEEFVPMVSGIFWNKLSPELQKDVLDSWEQVIGPGRLEMRATQVAALKNSAANGVQNFTPDPVVFDKWKDQLAGQIDPVKTGRVDPAFAKMVEDKVAATTPE